MGKVNTTGIYQKPDGYWAYRFAVVVDGKKICRKKCTDKDGRKLKTKSDAAAARDAAIRALRVPPGRQTPTRCTVKTIFEEFRTKGRKDRAYQTIKKQDSIWKNHMCAKFGERYLDTFTSGEIMDYLTELYYVEGYSYRYVESFLKMFYLIFGQAYSRGYLDRETYDRFCTNKDTKIKMPKLKRDDDMDIVIFTQEELAKLDKYFKGTNTETAYMLGRYCGLRVNECFGLKWSNVDLENGTITIDRQMQYQEGLIKLLAPKTRNSRRTIHMNDILLAHMKERYARRQEEEKEYADLRYQNRRWITDVTGELIPSTDMVNCLYNGRLQTPHSLKYATREIKDMLRIEFKYHYLRHPYVKLKTNICYQPKSNVHRKNRSHLSSVSRQTHRATFWSTIVLQG